MRLARSAAPALALVVVLAALGCDSARPIAQESAVGNCTACHGGVDNQTGAPPRDLRGNDADPLGGPARIGAHTSHLQAGVLCESCHVVPAHRDDPGHFDATPGAEVVFGAAARADGADPQYAGGTCSGVYCHGATLNAGGSAPTPSWGEQLTGCGICHGAPPPSHGAVTDCSLCHGASVNDDDVSIKPGGGHLNGSLDLDITNACTGCHGDPNRVTAVPVNKAAPATGAHLPHLLGDNLAGGFACTECHAIPTDLSHADTPPAEVTFNGPRGNQGTSPTYAAQTCSNVYCHGATLLGGTNKEPLWNGAAQDACGTCHGRPPIAPHPQVDKSGVAITANVQCSQCHPGTVFGPSDASPGTINVANGLHVNGTKDVDFHAPDWPLKANHGRAANYNDPVAWPAGIATCRSCHGANLDGGLVGVSCDSCHTGATSAWRTTCTFCHGDANRIANPAAPPAGALDTEFSTSDRAVGAHQKHLGNGSTISNGVACTECHATPADIAHVDGTALITWGTLARTGGASPVWNGTTCTASYCHGSTLPGTRTAPVWAPPTALGCGSCHETTPTTGEHPSQNSNHSGFDCSVCHGAGFSSGTSVDKAVHINGTVNKASSLNWVSTPVKSCDPACHGRKDW